MSITPQQMQQMLAMYKQQFPTQQSMTQPAPLTPDQQQLAGLQQASASLGAGPGAGTNRAAGGVNAGAQLAASLLQARKMKQIQQGLDQSRVQQGMPAANAAQGSAIDDYMKQNPVMPLDLGSQ